MPFLAYGRTLTETELRVDLMGRYLGEALPANAVVLSFLQSGALAFYTRRPIVRLDLLAPDTLDAAIIELGQRGYHPVIVLDELMEAPAFPARFPGSALRTLDWPPRAIARDAGAALLYFDPADRPDAQRGHQWAVDVIARR